MKADFYLIQKERFREEPLRLVCELAKRAFANSLPTLVLVRDRAQAEELDDLLWSFEPDAFIPHQIAGEDMDEEEADVLIAPPDADAPMRPLVINLRDAAVEGGFERVLEVVPADPAARDPLRERWRQYKARGFELKKHDM
ncbi:DNA polymerase III subunit chi [Novilysobacter defluvii]|uniref:DNA polymerase III subunit chi n=1 Tax=Lysobacter defluvii IMMIB APB-9 = DSM 18482 TaxID=1385515 RepID=A0A0A0M9V3_9GAMM|nr:DNA polymerase III subunit chi [Lysobacter defluvii]KGO98999.1 DNA polymerase III subunit chi [Lysobacter defluvii IMMIB APB-9 = DSM 18482]